MSKEEDVLALQARIERLEEENALLRRDFGAIGKGVMVKVPEAIKPLFDVAQGAVSEYFRHLKMDPTQGTIEINEQRYVLVRASALSKDFLDTIRHLYADRGESEAISIGKNFLFDISHVIGMNDARAFHQKMNFTDPLSKLSAGPIHFAYSGWAFVEILPDSNPTPDDDFYLHYNHPYSFEADSWLRSGTRSETSVCIMNAGYSSGWCEESFGIPLTSVEVSCRAKGDTHCSFIMSPPHKIEEHLDQFKQAHTTGFTNGNTYQIPTFFERKKVEEELQRARILAEESVKTKADFLANMSHELRTPLGAILGFTELLGKTTLSRKQEEYLDAIHTSGNNLLSIINDILDLSKIDAGQFVIESIPFSIPELMHSIEVMFAARAAEKSLALTCTSDPALSGHVLGDPMRLTQILTNLVGNAIKFTEQGSIRAHCSLERESAGRLYLTFSVKDTGIGIPEHMADHIFERFTQADTDITRRYGGTGLGLAITKQLVALQGGTITLDTSLGKGTTFYVSLSYPIAVATPASSKDKQGVRLPKYDKTKSILLVEDNYMVQKLAEIMLEQAGFHTLIAANGAAAVELLRKQTFDLVLMDIQMPVMDGYKATRIIRDELHISTPIIAMTAHALAGEKEICIRKGMNDYIAKPFREDELLGKVTYWLSQTTQATEAPKGIIDLSFLRQQTYDNRAFILEMISYFRKHNPEDVGQLEAAIAAADYDAVYKTTHRLRNTILFFGLQKIIGSQLERMENLAGTGTGIEEIAALFREIKPVFTRAVQDLAEPDPELFA